MLDKISSRKGFLGSEDLNCVPGRVRRGRELGGGHCSGVRDASCQYPEFDLACARDANSDMAEVKFCEAG